jgi:hypothetical protein
VKEGHNQRAEPCPACSPDRVAPDPPFCHAASDDGGMEDLPHGRRMTKRPATCAGSWELRRAEPAETVPISRRVAQLRSFPCELAACSRASGRRSRLGSCALVRWPSSSASTHSRSRRR